MITPTKQEFEHAQQVIEKYYNDVLKKIKCNCCAPVTVIFKGDAMCNTCGGARPKF
jgi:hypothetical protein